MASSTSLQVAGLASNFDWKSFIDQIMEVERAPINRLTAEQNTNNQKVASLSNLGSRLSSLSAAASDLKADGLFGKRTASASTWSASAAADTATGAYKIAVTKLATAASLTGTSDIGSALNPTNDDVDGLTVANLPIGQAITAGTFTVNGQKVSVALTDSLQDVFDAIADATGDDVTASYDHTTDTIQLHSASGEVVLGAANDTSNLLRALKLGNNGTDTVASTARLGTVKTGATLAQANLGTAITAVDSGGAGKFSLNGVEIDYNVNTDTLAAVLKRINDSDAGVSASYDAVNDRVVLANKSTGDLGIGASETGNGLLTALGLGSGTALARGSNAEFTVNGGPALLSASNTLDASAHGIAGLSVTASSEGTETVNVAADTSTMRTKIEAFVTKFNEVQQYIDSVTKVSTDSKGKVTAAVLASNREIQEWSRSLRTIAFSAVSGLTGSSVQRLSDLGIDFKSGTNELEIKSGSKLDAALADNSADVTAFFQTASTGFAAKLSAFAEKVSGQNTEQQSRLNKSNTSIDEQIAAIERRLEQQRSLMESNFIAMETAQSKIKQQQSSLDGFLAKQSSS